MTSRLQYRDYVSNHELYEYQLRITPYKNEGGVIDMFTIAPKYAYKKYKNGTDYRNTVGTDLYLTGNLPLGFTWKNNLYLDYNMYNNDVLIKGVDNNGKLKEKAYNKFLKKLSYSIEKDLEKNWYMYNLLELKKYILLDQFINIFQWANKNKCLILKLFELLKQDNEIVIKLKEIFSNEHHPFELKNIFYSKYPELFD